ncbi:metallophosphoesterase family protein [Saccharibacillus sacchari]|uniref:metallophosphoesterase family protein n=1 Tax=Saccharibacillus sacchari TaxID=456493 RepID=UPI0004BA5633|nr:metallophosphoesterase [Saccharibacillus sacchari]
MRIVKLDPEPLDAVPYLSAASGGGIEHIELPVHSGKVEGLPAQWEALIVTSDLQGTCQASAIGQERLLGEELAEHLALLLQLEFPKIDPQRVLVLLCGDLYADPNVRGSSGDPLPVLRAFSSQFGSVAGVAGNHDLFSSGEPQQLEQVLFFEHPGIQKAAGMRIAGLGGIMGRADRPNRMPKELFLRELKRLLARKPDLLLLHQGPDKPTLGLRGDAGIRKQLESASDTLVCCGHVHWEQPLAEIGQVQVLNADGRAFILTQA